MNLRARLLLSGILAVLVVASSAVIQSRFGPRAPERAEAVDAETGAWFCPHGGLWRTWVTVGNPGEETATVRVTTFGGDGIAQQETFDLEGGADHYVEVPTEAPGAGSMVEFFGQPVAAGWVSQDDTGVAAEPCRSSAGRTWYVADGNTEADPDRESWLVVMNPFNEDAAFDVTLLVSNAPPTRAGSLRGYVLKAHRTVAFNLNRYLLDKPAVGVILQASLGAVSVAELGVTAGVGIRAVTAVPRPAHRWVLPSALGASTTGVAVQNASERSAAVSVREQTHLEQRPVETLQEESLSGLSIRPYDPEAEPGPSSLIVEATAEVPVVVARRTLGQDGDVGSTSGASTSAASWVVPPSVPPEGGEQRLVLENDGLEDATVHVELFGQASADLGEVLVPAGRTVALVLDEDAGGAPVWVSVRAEEGTIVASSASRSLEGAGFALALGVPLGPVSEDV